jgi:CheY-like chemotaxis protein
MFRKLLRLANLQPLHGRIPRLHELWHTFTVRALESRPSCGDRIDQGMMAVIEESPDLVLMDLRMPNQAGMQLYRALRLRDEFGRIPVIFVTGMTEFQIFGKDSTPLPKPEAFIEKPINLDALHAAIEQLIG